MYLVLQVDVDARLNEEAHQVCVVIKHRDVEDCLECVLRWQSREDEHSGSRDRCGMKVYLEAYVL